MAVPTQMTERVAEVQELSKRFGDFTAVDAVSFDVRRGEVLGYVGPNGSGKTTTIRMLLGLLQPSGGSGTVFGLDIARQTEEIRTRVGYMSQRFALYDELSARENLSFYAGVYGAGEQERVGRAIQIVGLQGVMDMRAGDLPIGWRQRLALATAIVHQPALLILDEPTSGVDPVARRAFWNLIYELADQGVTALVTTHYMDEAEYCNRVGIMRRGRLLALDTPSALKRSALPRAGLGCCGRAGAGGPGPAAGLAVRLARRAHRRSSEGDHWLGRHRADAVRRPVGRRDHRQPC